MKKTIIFLTILSFAVTAAGLNKTQEGSPKTWSQSQIDSYYRQMAINRRSGERPTRRVATLSGNQIRTLIFDFGSIGAPGREPSLEWPIYSDHGYGYEFGPLVGVEVPLDTSGNFLPYVEQNGVMVPDTGNAIYDKTLHIISDGLLARRAPQRRHLPRENHGAGNLYRDMQTINRKVLHCHINPIHGRSNGPVGPALIRWEQQPLIRQPTMLWMTALTGNFHFFLSRKTR